VSTLKNTDALVGPETGTGSIKRLSLFLYYLPLLVGISVWFRAIHAPLWLDETVSYWQIAAGFRQIWARSLLVPSSPTYLYILWLTNTFFGHKEIILRIPSILAMLIAVSLFFRIAKELFPVDVSLIATVVFSLNADIAFAALDVRPYAFAILFTNLAILPLLLWIKTGKRPYAILFGIACAGILHFQYLFGTILIAFLLYYVLRRFTSHFYLIDLSISFGCFLVLTLPLASQMANMFHQRGTHVFADAPELLDILRILSPGRIVFIFMPAVLVAVFAKKIRFPNREGLQNFFFCLLLAFVPTAILYLISVNSQLHLFIPRYLLVAIPGIALSWAWLVSLIDSRTLRLLFCLSFVAFNGYRAYTSPFSGSHGYTWKYALQFADGHAAADNSTLLICSDLPESDSAPMPAVASESVFFAPLSYYPVHAPVVPLPRTLNSETKRQVNEFLRQSTGQRRFLVLAYIYSARTIDWIAYATQTTHTPHSFGQIGGVWVAEFVPRAEETKTTP
jgi:dolichyl-phosphate-mannose-protein mannosyltransferase